MGLGSNILVVNFSQVNGNTANGGPMAHAGGIVNGGTAAIKASTVDGNTASGGAGGGILIIKATRMTGETAPADSSGDQGMGGTRAQDRPADKERQAEKHDRRGEYLAHLPAETLTKG